MSLLALLEDKHLKDVFVPECKEGATWTGNGKRLDAWVLKRTWSPVTTIGYEIKTNRSDFLRDDKWPTYLGCCHHFYWVCPAGLIDKSEISAECGLLYATKTGGRLYTKKKAPRREIDPPWELLIYVLMSRASIGPSQFGYTQPREPGTAYWRRWLAKREEKRELGARVSRAVATKVAEAEGARLLAEAKVEGYELFRGKLREAGIDPELPLNAWRAQSIIRELQEALPPGLVDNMEKTGDCLRSLADRFRGQP